LKPLQKKKVELENRQWYEKFRWFTSSEGFLVVAGKDTVSNESDKKILQRRGCSFSR